MSGSGFNNGPLSVGEFNTNWRRAVNLVVALEASMMRRKVPKK